ncbi:dual-specificity kinase [Malassezia furfur]|uniref:Dual-specificity kinase n=1 Tax=Malassezia furfur TaxID=55194 RepID=A0ABY8EUQ0_MALFU|nr:dual-specificity kinase [Malassezia furfur]
MVPHTRSYDAFGRYSLARRRAPIQPPCEVDPVGSPTCRAERVPKIPCLTQHINTSGAAAHWDAMDTAVGAVPRTPPRDALLTDADASPLPTPPRLSHVYAAGQDEPNTPTARPLRTDAESREHSTPHTSTTARTLRSSATAHTGPRGVGTGLRKLRSAVRTGSVHVPARRVLRYQDEEEAEDDENQPGHAAAARQDHSPPLPPAPPASAAGAARPDEVPAAREEGALRVPGRRDLDANPRSVSSPCVSSSIAAKSDVRAPAGAVRSSSTQLRSPPRERAPLAEIANVPSAAVPAPAAPIKPARDAERSAPSPEPVDFLHQMLVEAERQGRAQYTPPKRAGQKPMAKETTFRGCRFLKVQRAGEGGFSTVWQVRGPTAIPAAEQGGEVVRMEEVDESRQGYFAMKQVSLRRLEPESRDELIQEAQLLEQLAQQPGHERYILRYFGHRLNKDTLKIVRGERALTQLLELGEMDFSSVLKAHGPLTHAQICVYWRQMLEAVHFVHEKGNLVHTDLKPANFLLVRERLKLIDFGIAQKIPLGTIHISRDAIVGTPNYMAPEAIKIAKAHGRRVYKAGKASDVWSLGCILYQMVYGRPPFDRVAADRKLETIMDRGHVIAFPPHRVLDDPASERVDPCLLATLQATLRYDAAARATIPELLRDPLLHGGRGAPLGVDDDATVTISRRTLRELVVRLHAQSMQGELTAANAAERAERLFERLAAAAAPSAPPAPTT